MRVLLACFSLLAALLSVPAHADDNRPLTISVTQGRQVGELVLQWKIPPNIERRLMPTITPPENCVAGPRTREWSDALGHWREQRWTCAQGLAGQAIAIDYPLANPGLATIARIHSAAGGTQTLLLQPGENVLEIPSADEARQGGTFLQFLTLGFEHIWEGIDHLLFVTGLIIIAGTWKRILVTVTGFTVAHSVTLGLAALDLVSLPTRAVEAVIALSIVFLAVEIVKGPRDSLTWRRPVAVAASFGLLHGFGFASVLREIGLPDQGLLTALLAFNIGIEIGQVIFAALLFALLQMVMRFRPVQPKSVRHQGAAPVQLQRFAGYALGIIASYWLIGRVIGA